MLSFHLSINVIIIVVSFKILDLCPIALFQQLWKTLYTVYFCTCYTETLFAESKLNFSFWGECVSTWKTISRCQLF